jgi:phosphoribosylformylglycinamidine synthase I
VNFGVIVFPGTWSETDCHYAVTESLGQEARYLSHRDTNLEGLDCLILPGGFSYGDYLRTGAIARFAPVMERVAEFVERGGLVIGICNGFQILCEAGLLPGALLRNQHLEFRCRWVNLRVENLDTPFTSAFRHAERSEASRRGEEGAPIIRVPISHGEGNYYADPETLDALNANNQVVFRYCDDAGEVTEDANPNGSIQNIAGITNRRGNVLGMMPHPERCCDPIIGGTDGLLIFKSILNSMVAAG